MYVDNVFVTVPDLETLLRIIQGVEKVAGAGGFRFMEWMVPGWVSDGERLMSLQGYDEVEKTLGQLLDSLGENESPSTEQLPRVIKPKLTQRFCLRFYMKIFDPLGLVMPTKIIGNLLFRISLQVIKKEGKRMQVQTDCFRRIVTMNASSIQDTSCL